MEKCNFGLTHLKHVRHLVSLKASKEMIILFTLYHVQHNIHWLFKNPYSQSGQSYPR